MAQVGGGAAKQQLKKVLKTILRQIHGIKLIKQPINLICKGIAPGYSQLESPLYKQGVGGGRVRGEFSKFSLKVGKGLRFFHKREGLVKQGVVLKKVGILSLIFIPSNPFQFESEQWFVFYLYTICINIVCVSWEEPSLIESSQQICDFYKIVTNSSHPVHFRKLYQNQLKFLFSHFVVLEKVL